jgi:hypothetical protein
MNVNHIRVADCATNAPGDERVERQRRLGTVGGDHDRVADVDAQILRTAWPYGPGVFPDGPQMSHELGDLVLDSPREPEVIWADERNLHNGK